MVANITNDISLLRQIREGNEDAFKSLFETYFTPLCRFIYLHLDDKNVAEELAMDIFIYLWENRETFQIQLSLKAYLFQAAKNKCLNELRKKSPEQLRIFHPPHPETGLHNQFHRRLQEQEPGIQLSVGSRFLVYHVPHHRQ